MSLDVRIPGTVDDLSACVDLEADHPFFCSPEEADRFVNLAVIPNVPHWGRRLRIVDFGGGQGLLADRCASALLARGHDACACVIDANPVFINAARARGLEARQANLVSYSGECVDLALMRFVLHYNPPDAQRAILDNICRHLEDGGALVLQLETADVAACELRNRIAALSATWFDSVSRFWGDIHTVSDWLRQAGFTSISIVSESVYESDVIALLRNAWRRQRATLESHGVDARAFYRACTDEIFKFRQTDSAHVLYNKGGRLRIKTRCPILVATKTPQLVGSKVAASVQESCR